MIPFVAVGPGPDYPAVADVELAVEYDFGNLTGTLTGGSGSGDALEATSQQILALLQGVMNGDNSAVLAELDSGGAGARTVTITVNDGAAVLENAIVRLVEGVNNYTRTTNASGVAVFNVDDATYTVSITKSGYDYAGTTLVVDGTETVTYSMDQTAATPPSAPNLSVLTILCLDAAGAIESGVSIDIRIITVPSGDTNTAYKGSKQTVVSGVDGIASLEAVRGATYEYKRGTRDVWAEVTIGDAATTDVTSFIGSP